jgi:hypothetical protein
MRATRALHGFGFNSSSGASSSSRSSSSINVSTLVIYITLVSGPSIPALGAGFLRLRPRFGLPAAALSFSARFARASSRSLKLITFALPRTTR